LWRKASQLYSAACELQPFASAGWLDWAKLEEERGRLKASCEILKIGLMFCESNEALVTKRIKLEERLYNNYGSKQMFKKATKRLRFDDKEDDDDDDNSEEEVEDYEGNVEEEEEEEEEHHHHHYYRFDGDIDDDVDPSEGACLGGDHSDNLECGLIAQFQARLICGKDMPHHKKV
jgi:hypothetical protein